MTERDNRRVSNLEKAARGVVIATTILTSCRPGEQAPSLDEVDDTNAGVEESRQEAESSEQGEIRVTEEAFMGSEMKETGGLKLESTQSLGLGVEKTNAIVEELKERGLNPEDTIYVAFYKVDEAGKKELVLITSTPSVEDENENMYFYVSGKNKDDLFPVEKGDQDQVEFVELIEYTETEGGETIGLRFEPDEGDPIPVIEFGENIDSYRDPYIKVVTRMSKELSSEVMAMLSSMPEGAQELVDRLGEGAEIVGVNLVYNGTIIGELDSENQVSFQVEEKTISISTENLQIKDGVLLAVNKERTGEMGVDWVEQVWVEGERIAVLEPVVGLPETYEETLVVKEESLDYFMPKLLVAEKKWLDENGERENVEFNNNVSVQFPFPQIFRERQMPYVERPFISRESSDNNNVLIVSWTRLRMSSGKELDFVGVPFLGKSLYFGSSRDENFIWHFVSDSDAAKNWVEEVVDDSSSKIILDDRVRTKYVFETFNEGRGDFVARMFIDATEVSGWAEEYNWTESKMQDLIRRDGFEDIDVLMKRISLNIPGYSEIMGKQMVYTRQEGGVQVPGGFLEKMEEQLIPSLMILGEDF